MEEQATEIEQERESFDKEINDLKECLKAKERGNLFNDQKKQEAC